MYTPVHPSFNIYKLGVSGYKSHGHVILMPVQTTFSGPGRHKYVKKIMHDPSIHASNAGKQLKS